VWLQTQRQPLNILSLAAAAAAFRELLVPVAVVQVDTGRQQHFLLLLALQYR
jgi:hypothetical protein